MKLHHIPEPLTDEERYLVDQLEGLQRAYMKAAEPYVERLKSIAACKQPRFFIEIEPSDTVNHANRFTQ